LISYVVVILALFLPSLPLYEIVQTSSVAAKPQGSASFTEELDFSSATLEELATTELELEEDSTELEDTGVFGVSAADTGDEESSPHAIKFIAIERERPKPIFL
jgi:hypothetical protein